MNNFFKKLKQEDQSKTIPEFEAFFPKKQTSWAKRYAIPLVIAAVILLLLFPIYKTKQQDQVAASDVMEIIISLEYPEENPAEEVSIDQWKSSPSFLIENFND